MTMNDQLRIRMFKELEKAAEEFGLVIVVQDGFEVTNNRHGHDDYISNSFYTIEELHAFFRGLECMRDKGCFFKNGKWTGAAAPF